MAGQNATDLSSDILEKALDTYATIQRKRVEALYNLHRAVFAESLVATLLPGAELSPDPAHDFDISWPDDGVDIRVEVKCSGEYLPRYGIEYQSPASWDFPIPKRIWDYESRIHVPNDSYRFDVLVLARHVGDLLAAGWSFYVVDAAKASEMGGRVTPRSLKKLTTVQPDELPASVRDAHQRLLSRDVTAP